MTSPLKTIRIFISSPGDVQEERNRAKAVVEQLRRSFAGRLELEAVLWEELRNRPSSIGQRDRYCRLYSLVPFR
jgi:hypothetical protein